MDALNSSVGIAICAVVSVLVTLAGVWLSGRLPGAAADTHADPIRRIVRNSAIPIVSQLLVRVLDLAVAIYLLRLLGPSGNGQYAVAVIVWLYAKTISDFGLGLLATREIARERSSMARMVGMTTLFRWLVLGIVSVPIATYTAIGLSQGSLSRSSVLAIALLYLSIVPSSLSEAVNSALNGVERMDIAAWLNIVVSLARAPLVIALAATRLEVVGVALAALISATISAGLFTHALRCYERVSPVWSITRQESRWLARASWPLLVNALLVSLFFRADVFIVQAVRGDAALGIYDAAYKLINLVTIVPAYITLAIFPTLAQRSSDPQALAGVLRTAAHVLVWIAWGIVALGVAGADTAIRILAGGDYLPEAATLLRILIWFAPLSFLNGVVQYVLVATDRQQRLVPVFAAAVIFNLGFNLALVPAFGARSAAMATVLTEVVILIIIAVVTARDGAPVITRILLSHLIRPSVAGSVAVAVAIAANSRWDELIAIPLTLVTFGVASYMFGVVGPEQRALLRRALDRPPTAPTDVRTAASSRET